MAADRYDYVIVGGGSAGSALANRLSADPSTSVLVLEAGRTDRFDPFIHMPAALPFPIGNRLYDWKYESEPEPHMGGRRVYHARGKVLGGSSSINGMIFQRGNPMDYERWAAEPGMEAWDYRHCLPYFKRMETCPARRAAAPTPGAAAPARSMLERGPATTPLFGAFFEAAQQAGYPLTDDVNGYRQEGFAALRPQHRQGRAALRRAGLPAPGDGSQEPHRPDPRPGHRVRFDGTRAVGVDYLRAGRRHQSSRPARSSSAAARSTPRSCSSSPASATPSTSSRSASTGPRPARRRREPPGPPRGLHPARLQAAGLDRAGAQVAQPPRIGLEWLSCAPASAASNHFEAGGFFRCNEDVDYPNLMFHFLPIAIRYDGSPPAGRRAHGYQVHIGPMYSDIRGAVRIASTDPLRAPGRCSSTTCPPTNDRREWIEMVRVARNILEQPAFAPFNGGEISPGPAVEHRPGDPRLGAPRTPRPRCTPPAPRRWAPTTMSVVDPSTMRVHGIEGLRVVDASRDALRHQRQHLRAGDDARREGRRPDRRQHAAGPADVPYYRHGDGMPLYPQGDPRNDAVPGTVHRSTVIRAPDRRPASRQEHTTARADLDATPPGAARRAASVRWPVFVRARSSVIMPGGHALVRGRARPTPSTIGERGRLGVAPASAGSTSR